MLNRTTHIVVTCLVVLSGLSLWSSSVAYARQASGVIDVNPEPKDLNSLNGQQVWICRTDPLTPTIGIELEELRKDNGREDVCKDDTEWTSAVLSLKTGTSLLEFDYPGIDQSRIEAGSDAFLLVVDRGKGGSAWVSKMEEGTPRFYTPEKSIQLFPYKREKLFSGDVIPRSVLEPSATEMSNAEQPEIAVNPRRGGSNDQGQNRQRREDQAESDSEEGFWSFIPGWMEVPLYILLFALGVYAIVWLHHYFVVMDQMSSLRAKINHGALSTSINTKQVVTLSGQEAERLLRSAGLDLGKLSRLDPDNINQMIKALSDKIDKLESASGARSRALQPSRDTRNQQQQTDTPQHRQPVQQRASTPDNAFVLWCQEAGGQVGKPDQFELRLQETMRDVKVDRVFRDQNNESAIVLSRKMESLGAPQEYWLISFQSQHYVVPQPQNPKRFREVHQGIYQSNGTSPSQMSSIYLANVDVAGDQVTLRSPGRIS